MTPVRQRMIEDMKLRRLAPTLSKPLSLHPTPSDEVWGAL
jgi:hypothetical protein